MHGDVALQTCINHVTASYVSVEHRRVSFARSVWIRVGSFEELNADMQAISPPDDLLPPGTGNPRFDIPFTPLFNPFRRLSLTGTWYDSGVLHATLIEGVPMYEEVPAANAMQADVLSFSIRRYVVSATERGSITIYSLKPIHKFFSFKDLWLDTVVLDDNCKLVAVELRGNQNRRLSFRYFDSGSTPLIRSIQLTEELEDGRTLSSNIVFDQVAISQ